jgi:hypothetical protein
MAVNIPPTVADVQSYFLGDKLISYLTAPRIQFWIDDIQAKGIIEPTDWGTLYTNGFMSLLGHYLYYMELPVVSTSGAVVSSDSTAAVSRSFAVSPGNNMFEEEFKTTKYGRMYLSLQRRLAILYGGFVSAGGTYL